MSLARKLELYVTEPDGTGEELILPTQDDLDTYRARIDTEEAAAKRLDEEGRKEEAAAMHTNAATMQVHFERLTALASTKEERAKRYSISYHKPSYRRFLEIKAEFETLLPDDRIRYDNEKFELALLEEMVKDTKSAEDIEEMPPNVVARFAGMALRACWPNQDRLLFLSSPAKTP